MLKDSDYAGYNIKRFDVPLLVEEFLRVEIDWPSEDAKIIDAYTIFVKKEQRNLAAAYKFFCDKDLKTHIQPKQIFQPLKKSYSLN